jgi:hypothetical protein
VTQKPRLALGEEEQAQSITGPQQFDNPSASRVGNGRNQTACNQFEPLFVSRELHGQAAVQESAPDGFIPL